MSTSDFIARILSETFDQALPELEALEKLKVFALTVLLEKVEQVQTTWPKRAAAIHL